MSRRLQAISYRQFRREYAAEREQMTVAMTAAQPVSTKQVPLDSAVVAAFQCEDCPSDVVIPEVRVLHEPTCPTLRRI
jgi:hypothetical protein